MRLLLILFFAAGSAFAQQKHVLLNPAATKVNFTLGDVLHTVHGIFALSSGDFWFDPATNQAGGKLTVSAASGDTGSGARDSRMKKNVLQSTLYPEIAFIPDRISGTVNLAGDSNFQMHGLFTIHGASHELAMNVKSHIEGDNVSARVDFDVPYVQWGMKDPSTLILRVSDTVKIDVETNGHLQ